MPTATDPIARPHRRQALALLALAPWCRPLLARPQPAGAAPVRLAAAWVRHGVHQVGWLAWSAQTAAWQVAAALDVPGRAHGVVVDRHGHLLAVARRPGDWLLHWAPPKPPTWHWAAQGLQFSGHVLPAADGRHVWTTQTDPDSGQGLLGVHDARSLALRAVWPTGGRDPHQLLPCRLQPGQLLVANGGIETRAETGRHKHGLANMDSSLVRLNPADGRLGGRWQLPDSRLSLRHLAWQGQRLGVALQAEHGDAATRAAAPVLAVFDGEQLLAQAPSLPLAGYGGDVAAAGGGFAVACPRAHRLALFDSQGHLQQAHALDDVCALASDGQGGIWAGGHPASAHAAGTQAPPTLSSAPGWLTSALPHGLRLDNHWWASA